MFNYLFENGLLHMYSYSTDPVYGMQQITQSKITQNNGVEHFSIGPFGMIMQITYIIPTPNMDPQSLNRLVDEAMREQYALYSQFTGNPHKLIDLDTTSAHAKDEVIARQQMAQQTFNPERHFALTSNHIHEIFSKISNKEVAIKPVAYEIALSCIAKFYLGNFTLPENAAKQIPRWVMQIQKSMSSRYRPSEIIKFNRAAKEYIPFWQELKNENNDFVKETLENSTDTENFMVNYIRYIAKRELKTDDVAELKKKELELLDQDDVWSDIVGILLPTDYLARLIALAIAKLTERQDVFDSLKEEISQLNILDSNNNLIDNALNLLENNSPKLYAFYQECLRYFSPVPVLARNTHLAIPEFNIPAKSNIVIDIRSANRSPQFWKDPNVFNPERFQDPSVNQVFFKPFGFGDRHCPADKICYWIFITTMINILGSYQLTCDNPGQISMHYRLENNNTATVSDDLTLKFSR